MKTATTYEADMFACYYLTRSASSAFSGTHVQLSQRWQSSLYFACPFPLLTQYLHVYINREVDCVFIICVVCGLTLTSRSLQRFTPCSPPSSPLTLTSASTPTWAKTSPWMRTDTRSWTCCRPRAPATWRGTRRSWGRSPASSPERKAPSRGWQSGCGWGRTCITACPPSCRSTTVHIYLTLNSPLLQRCPQHVRLVWLVCHSLDPVALCKFTNM